MYIVGNFYVVTRVLRDSQNIAVLDTCRVLINLHFKVLLLSRFWASIKILVKTGWANNHTNVLHYLMYLFKKILLRQLTQSIKSVNN